MISLLVGAFLFLIYTHHHCRELLEPLIDRHQTYPENNDTNGNSLSKNTQINLLMIREDPLPAPLFCSLIGSDKL
jgi:hypothetical protein